MITRKWTESKRAAEGGTDVSSLCIGKSTCVFTHSLAKAESSAQ